jgi:hypothetical protein
MSQRKRGIINNSKEIQKPNELIEIKVKNFASN